MEGIRELAAGDHVFDLNLIDGWVGKGVMRFDGGDRLR